ncbi:SOS response-associated peptidase [Xenophilus sp. Marseille-Q4582]|uniref:SOS response-associated peptidase n=1 Tax=Xenophilus sp. Marseille-Q4582 TaxID=2866600 RepID=UPI001CE41591|nr:SOS response-associated peptidase family protein [Xenophilus sp. Marseille-Q4582]
MCSNYEPVTRADRLLSFFDVLHKDSPSIVAFPTGLAPFIRLSALGHREALDGRFGLLPYWAKEVAYGRRTYNARSETVATLPSYRAAWKKGQRCIVPAETIFEPSYETGRAVRWGIQQPGQVPLGIAGIYESWKNTQTQQEEFSFSMLTVNADGHPVMQRFHKPGDEKRMVVILHPEDYDDWLTCAVDEAPRYFKQWMGPLDTFPAPLPPRAPRTKAANDEPPPVDKISDDDEPQLF